MGRQGRRRPPRCLLSAGALPLPATFMSFLFPFSSSFFFSLFNLYIFSSVVGFPFLLPPVFSAR